MIRLFQFFFLSRYAQCNMQHTSTHFNSKCKPFAFAPFFRCATNGKKTRNRNLLTHSTSEMRNAAHLSIYCLLHVRCDLIKHSTSN